MDDTKGASYLGAMELLWSAESWHRAHHITMAAVTELAAERLEEELRDVLQVAMEVTALTLNEWAEDAAHDSPDQTPDTPSDAEEILYDAMVASGVCLLCRTNEEQSDEAFRRIGERIREVTDRWRDVSLDVAAK